MIFFFFGLLCNGSRVSGSCSGGFCVCSCLFNLCGASPPQLLIPVVASISDGMLTCVPCNQYELSCLLFCFSMLDVFSDQFGLLDFQRSQHGSGMSGRSKVKVIERELFYYILLLRSCKFFFDSDLSFIFFFLRSIHDVMSGKLFS